jgi:AcrR family transcriptional regulator
VAALASAKRPGRRQQESERRRQAILEAAARVFGARGYAGATVAQIAHEAGVSAGLLYQFYRSKDELLDVVLQSVVRDWVREMVPRNPAESALDALEGMFRRSVGFCRTHPLLPALMSGDPGLQLERLRSASSDRVQPHRDLVAAILERGIASGELRGDLDVAAVAQVVCQLQGEYSRRAYRQDEEFPASDTIIDAVARFIRDALRSG